MGINLTLAMDAHELGDPPLAYTRFGLNLQNYELFDALTEVSTPVPSGICWYDDDGLETVTEDCYGKPLTFVTASQFLKQWNKFVGGKITNWDEATIAFVKALRPDRKIVLWWH